MHFYWLVLGALAVWRVTHLLNAEDGPWDIFVRLRRLLGHGVVGSMFDCFYCLSLWTAAPVAWAISPGWRQWFLHWLGLSAGAILFEQLTRRQPETTPAQYYEEREVDHVVLRRPEDEAATGQPLSPAN